MCVKKFAAPDVYCGHSPAVCLIAATGSRGTSGAPGSSKPASPISSPVGSRGAPPGAGSADSGGGGGVGSGGSGGRAGSGDVDDNDKVCLEVLDPAGGADVSEEEPVRRRPAFSPSKRSELPAHISGDLALYGCMQAVKHPARAVCSTTQPDGGLSGSHENRNVEPC